jgi:hypothetical protein
VLEALRVSRPEVVVLKRFGLGGPTVRGGWGPSEDPSTVGLRRGPKTDPPIPRHRQSGTALMPPVAISWAMVAGMTNLRRPPDVVRRVRRPARFGRRLATVAVWAAAPGETMRVPPTQQAATVRVPATDRVQSLEKGLTTWVRTPAFTTDRRTARDKGEHECPGPHPAPRAVHFPIQFGRHHSSSSFGPHRRRDRRTVVKAWAGLPASRQELGRTASPTVTRRGRERTVSHWAPGVSSGS